MKLSLTVNEIFIILSIVALIGGFTIHTGRTHIDNRVERARAMVRQELHEDLAPRIDALKEEVVELQVKINNGLTHRQERIENKLDRLLEHYDLNWDGKERRRNA